MVNDAPRPPYLGLDMGERRIGVAFADGVVAIAVPLPTIVVDGSEQTQLKKLLADKAVQTVIVGLPRNQSGEPTAQTIAVRQQAARLLAGSGVAIFYQDESVTSVLAEAQLQQMGKAYTKADIDQRAATMILQDFLEQHR